MDSIIHAIFFCECFRIVEKRNASFHNTNFNKVGCVNVLFDLNEEQKALPYDMCIEYEN